MATIIKSTAKAKATPKAVSKATAKTAVAVAPDEVDALAYRKLVMDERKSHYDAAKEDYDELRGELLEKINETLPDASSAKYTGIDFTMAVGAKANTTVSMDTKRIFELLEGVQEGLALTLMKFNVTDLNKYLSGDEIATCIVKDNIGARTVKLTPKK